MCVAACVAACFAACVACVCCVCCVRVVARAPWGLSRVMPESLLGISNVPQMEIWATILRSLARTNELYLCVVVNIACRGQGILVKNSYR